MSGREPSFWTTIIAICAIAFIVSMALHCGIDDTLVKLGIAAIAGIAGFTFSGLVRKP
jgi:ammonia channel protein AmtB